MISQVDVYIYNIYIHNIHRHTTTMHVHACVVSRYIDLTAGHPPGIRDDPGRLRVPRTELS